MKLNKKIISILLAFSMLTSGIHTIAGASALYEDIKDTTVTSGVTHRKIEQFNESGWTKANILLVDLDNPDIQIRTMTAPDGSSYLANVKKMAEATGAVAAINSDFFNFTSNGSKQTNMLGMVYKDGELISTPSTDTGLANFVISDDNSVIMDYFTSYTDAISPQGYACQIAQINKMPLTGGAINKYTSAWSEYSFGTLDGMQEIVVEDDIVTDIRTNQEPVKIPENGYILYTNPSINGFFTDNFKVGDPIIVNTVISPEVDKIKEASGGGTILVKDGKIAPFTNVISGNAQRTAVGLDEDNNTLLLVTIDGRMSDCAGMDQTALAEYMLALGCETALNLDGGGSTTMVTRDRYTENLNVVNTLTSGSMRSIAVGLGVYSTAESDNIPYGIDLQLSQNTIMLGDSIEVYCAVYDSNHNNISIPLEDISFSIDDRNADIEKNKITPSKSGEHTITVSIDDISQEIKLTVIDNLSAISAYPNKADISVGESYQFAISGVDKDGNKATIPPALLNWSSSDPDVEVNNGLVTIKRNASAVITAEADGITAYATVSSTGEHPQKPLDIADEDKLFGEIKGTRINFVGELPKGNTMLQRLLSYKKAKSINESKAETYFTKGMGAISDSVNTTSHELGGYSVQTIDSTTIITLNNSKGSFRTSLANQWTNFQADIKKNNTKNVIIAMPNSIYDVNEGEQKVFRSYLSELTEQGKNVFVVYSDTETKATIEDGVRYISCGTVSGASSSTLIDYNIPASRYVYFTIDGRNIRFRFSD